MDQVTTYSTKFMEWLEVFGPKVLGALLVFIIGLYITNLSQGWFPKHLIKEALKFPCNPF
jgi:small conductance mechanosensitive channel